MRAAVGALADHPARRGLDPRLAQQIGQRHAGPFRARYLAEQFLAIGIARGRRDGVGRGVARAFEKLDTRHHGVAQQSLQVELQRPLDQTMNQ
ncbi:hypothetical protein D9M68_889350 [compost metagenome]